MNRENQSVNDIYENDFDTEGTFGKRTTDSHSELTGSDGVKISVSRAAVVCLVLLCVLLLTAVIVLCVHIFMKSTNDTQEEQQLLTKITNLTEERGQLLTNNVNLTKERDQLLTKITNLTDERDQLLTKITNLTDERDQLLTKITNLTDKSGQLLINNVNLTKERDQLLTKITNLTDERDQLLTNNVSLGKERDQLLTSNVNLAKERDQLKSEKSELQKLYFPGGWKWHQSSLYFLSSEMKNWTESRRNCTDRGADLIIINNREEQDFVQNISGSDVVWIGLNDIDVEGSWKWVDGSSVTFRFWQPGQPNKKEEDCALNHSKGWADYPCDNTYKWICEKSIFK